MDVGMMMVFASYGWDNCSDSRVWDDITSMTTRRSGQHPIDDLHDGDCPDIDIGTAAVILPWQDPLLVAE